MIQNLYLAKPRGYCAGVERAVRTVEKMLEIHGAPIYVKHAIVHNVHVVKDLEKKGAIFVEQLHEIPQNSTVVFSAHGSPPQDHEKARERKLKVVDAVCPLVTKVHFEAKVYAQKGYAIVQVGHRGHLEPIGVKGEVDSVGGQFYLIDNKEEAQKFKLKKEKVAILTQTTLSLSDTAEIVAILKRKFPNALFPPTKDICYATENRQEAVKLLAQKAQLVLVVGSKTSSNSNRLREVAQSKGAKAYLIDDKSFIKKSWLDGVSSIGLTSGASVPDYLVEEVINYLKNLGIKKVQELTATEEDTYFPLPQEIRGES